MSRIPKPMPSKIGQLNSSVSLNGTLTGRSVLVAADNFKVPSTPQAPPPAHKSKLVANVVPAKRTDGQSRTAVKPIRRTAAVGEASDDPQDGAAAPPAKKKRPQWDVRGRVEDLEMSMMISCQKQESLRQKLAEMEQKNALLENSNRTHQISAEKTSAEVEELQRAIRKLKAELSDREEQCDALKRKLDNVVAELDRTKSVNSKLETAVSEMSGQSRVLQIQIDTAATKLTEAERQLNTWRERCLQAEEQLAAAKEKIAADELIRRRLHNTVVELKGNIRVFCRMRPLLEHEAAATSTTTSSPFYSFPDVDGRQIELVKLDSDGNETCKAARFEFDRVFTPDSTQKEVFDEISQLVQSALDGYNVCVFAYGQTGSGKTYTMEGGDDFHESPGMVTLAMQQIFKCVEDLGSQGWHFKMSASFVEIYNETLRDLLSKENEGVNLEIKLVQSSSANRTSARGCQNEVVVPGLTMVDVSNVNEIHELILTARKSRAVAATKCNERSSRSHCVFCLKINSHNERTGVRCQGSLNLVDLAGSERLKESGAEGQRLEETKNINRSLSCLGQVFGSLSKKESYIPYRNSKLTYLLQNSLGGNSKTLMFVTISPRVEHAGETLNSLRFATMVNQCHIGVAVKKIA